MESLVPQLNQLLRALSIPITVQSPPDLTPSLLLAILESLLNERLPIADNLRRTAVSRTPESKNAQLQCVKIFLGVLEADVLQMDVGLSTVDPRKLANGEWDEVVFVGELLCWIYARLQEHSPSTATTATVTRTSEHFLPTESNSDHSPHLPRCIHEVPSPSSNFSPLPSRNISVRYTGTIEPVDEELEIQSFESSRSSHSLEQQPESVDQHSLTISLLKERARILQQLAVFKKRQASGGWGG
ncbi:hypothetical protein C8J56DRAFT_291277 [Mycena floridula]|nr:hypothetical protein C8J56DRAFT_291277 [Mycena floridula]